MKKSFILGALLLAAVSCHLDDAMYVKVQELDYAFVTESGTYTKEDAAGIVPAEGGSLSIRILSSGEVTISTGEMPAWASLDGEKRFSGDRTLVFNFGPNDGFRRAVIFTAHMDGVEPIQIIARQAGTVAYMHCDSPYRSAKGSVESSVSFSVDTNIPMEEISTSPSADWLGKPAAATTDVTVNIARNTLDISRKGTITLSYTDGWNNTLTETLHITQASASDVFGTRLDFPALRSMATAEGKKIEGDYSLTGIVVSDWRSANTEENPVLTLDAAGDFRNNGVSATVAETVQQVVDTTATRRTAYLESEDGALGFRLVFKDAAENRLVFGTRLTISLDGAVITKDVNPERYTLEGLTSDNMLESETGAVVPVKEKTIAALTDSDIYTFTSLIGLEFPVKEGSYTDIRENQALYSAVNDNSVSKTDTKRYFYMDSFANLLVDGEGRAICAPVNMLCTWRKPEGGIPQGAGPVKGIIVHNTIRRYGDAGRYQIRVVDETGYAGLTGASPWKTIAGWDLGKAEPSYGEAGLACDKREASMTDQHSYKSLVADTKRTCGISDTYRSIHVFGPITGWWDWNEEGEITGNHGLAMEFSTKDLTGEEIMVAFRFYAGRTGTVTTFQAFPAHWFVEYSIDGAPYVPAANADLSGKPYVHLRSIATYTLQYGSYKIPTSVNAGLGASSHAFCLPAETLGKEHVKVRIRPYDTVMSAIPSIFTDETESSSITARTRASDYVSFQDIFIRYR